MLAGVTTSAAKKLDYARADSNVAAPPITNLIVLNAPL